MDAGYAQVLYLSKQMMKAVAKFMEQGDHFVVSKERRAGLTINTDGCGEIAREVCYRRLDVMLSGSFSSSTAAADGIIHPAPAALTGPCIEVKIKPADQFSLSVHYIEELGVGMPELNIGSFHRGDNDAIKILHQPEHSR